MHASRFSNEVQYDYLGFALPYRRTRGLAFTLIRLGIDGIPDTRDALDDFGVDGIAHTGDFGECNGRLDGPVAGDPTKPGERLDPARIREFANADYAFFVSYAAQRGERLSLGGNLKVIRRGLGEFSALVAER